jgi:2-amino-4-hydroxy-6-hydroxymethyldihydropteridine diphosphokinase
MIILGLGSNTGDREEYLARAVSMLDDILTGMHTSSLYETAALLPEGAPRDWDMPFLNMAVCGDTSLSPDQLFATVKDIEKKLGRFPSEVWAPRKIDIDILAIENMVIDESALSVPHRALLDRDFALVPLAELVPDWCYPAGAYKGKRAADIVAEKRYILTPYKKEDVHYG